MPYRLLTAFEELFAGRPYLHRVSTHGDFVAMHLFEDLLAVDRSTKLLPRVRSRDRVLNSGNTVQGVKWRRCDGTLGETVPHTKIVSDPGFDVARGQVATVEIGVEVKILSKGMIKQIDRVINDLSKQLTHFRSQGGNPICVAIVGINSAPHTVGYEGDRLYRTDGSAGFRHPFQEAPEAERRLIALASAGYDEFIVLRYSATNESPFPFVWVNHANTQADYGAALVRISRLYDQRF